MAQTVQISDSITVGALAEKLMIPVTTLITELMKNGVMATVNERIDFDTAQIIVGELDLDVMLEKEEKQDKIAQHRSKRKQPTDGELRPPVVAVMGHVDHGKTSLLDAIQGSKITKSEAGGLTPPISARQA